MKSVVLSGGVFKQASRILLLALSGCAGVTDLVGVCAVPCNAALLALATFLKHEHQLVSTTGALCFAGGKSTAKLSNLLDRSCCFGLASHLVVVLMRTSAQLLRMPWLVVQERVHPGKIKWLVMQVCVYQTQTSSGACVTSLAGHLLLPVPI